MNKNKSTPASYVVSSILMYEIHGLKGVGKVLMYNRFGDPLLNYPNVKYKGKAFNVWLFNNILEPLLKRWGSHTLNGKCLTYFIKSDVQQTIIKIQEIFKVVFKECISFGETALMAASSVVLNLVRSILTIKDFMLGNRSRIMKPRRGKPKITDSHEVIEFEAEIAWCGLTYYPYRSDYFLAGVENPTNPEKLRLNRLDPGHVRNLFRCSNKVINDTCDEAVVSLKQYILKSEEFVMSDLGCLLSQSFPTTYDY